MTDGPLADWRPSASRESLLRRAELLRTIRQFLDSRGYVEVQTPVLSSESVIDAHIDPIAVPSRFSPRFLQTSPEAAMKRLLAADTGSIYQIGPVFRGGEQGERHNPEFTMLEWYRVGGDYRELMGEIDELARLALPGLPPIGRCTYRDAFRQHGGFDPFEIDDADLAQRARQRGFDPGGATRDDLLTFFLARDIEPNLRGPTFLSDFPSSQAALARIRPGNPPVAERFELYVNGLELCNGYQELTDAQELEERFMEQQRLRASAGKGTLPMPDRLLAAMRSGLPESAGVAMGFDRLVMLSTGARALADALIFPFDRA